MKFSFRFMANVVMSRVQNATTKRGEADSEEPPLFYLNGAPVFLSGDAPVIGSTFELLPG